MINFDITLFIQIAEALIMTFVLYYILVKPVMSYIRERESHFQTLEKETQELITLAEEAIKKYHEELNKARSEGIQKREHLKEEARKVEKEILSKVMKEMEEYKAKWAEQFSKQLEDVRKELIGNVEYFASLMVERLLGRKA
uniref:ATP synthase subunit b n=1 Tax=Thermodesulfobacterium geofontis TaxID=1295609 RepID=A0A7V6CDI6_9BACT